MKRQTPLISGLVYIIIGLLFVYLAAYNSMQEEKWGAITYIFILFATLDIGTGIKFITLHFKLKNIQKEKH